MTPHPPPPALAGLAVGLALLAGCSTFERDWKAMGEALRQGAGAGEGTGAEAVEGRWQGTWLSDVNGHTGGLRCILTSDQAGAFQARYHATYGWCFTFEHTVPMTLTQEGDVVRFAAEADLGWLAGGRYEYAGEIAGESFTSSYRCERDHGTFRMTRVD